MPGFASPLASRPSGAGNHTYSQVLMAFFGDSITFGATPNYPFTGVYSSTTGYRQYVYRALLAQGVNPICVGSIQDSVFSGLPASLAGDYYSGYSGTFWATWMPGAGANYLLGLVKPGIDLRPTLNVPTIIVLMLGANAGNDTGNGQGQLNLLDLITTTWPAAWVIQCSRTPQAASASNVVNAYVQAGVATRAAAGGRVSFFDMFPLITAAATDLPDGLHPSAGAYAVMGGAIAQYIVAGLAKGAFI